MSRIRIKTDYYGGALILVIGLSAILASRAYRIGSLGHMGPGFFPFSIGILLSLCGLLIAASAAFFDAPAGALPGPTHGIPDLRGGLCLILGVLAFLGFGTYTGLLPATFAIVFISALGDRNNSVRDAFLLSLAMCLIAAIVFSWGLHLQLPLMRWGF
jgi:hypothetical protein